MHAKCLVSAANLYVAPDENSALETQLLFGEKFEIKSEENGLARGVCLTDGYEGFVRTAQLKEETAATPAATHQVCAARTCLYDEPSAKARVILPLPLGAQVVVLSSPNKTNDTFADTFAQTDGGFIPHKHLAPLAALAPQDRDFVETAHALLGTPYIWGGRDSTKGLDCSALIQLAMAAVGLPAPRNSSDQEKTLGKPVAAGRPLARGDLLFWQAHVGVLLDENTLLHANAHHMAVGTEPLQGALPRLEKAAGPLRCVKRL